MLKFHNTTINQNTSSDEPVIECQSCDWKCNINEPLWLQAHLESPNHKERNDHLEIIPIERMNIMMQSQKLVRGKNSKPAMKSIDII